MKITRHSLTILLTAGLLVSSAFAAGGCGFELPFGLSGSHSAESAAADSSGSDLHPGIDDGAADDYLTPPAGQAQEGASDEAGSGMIGDGSTAGDQGSDTSSDNTGDGSEGGETAGSSAEAGDSSQDGSEFYILNAGDRLLGTEPMLEDPNAETIYVKAVIANVRDDATLEGQIIGTVRRGMSLLKYWEGDGWTEVRYQGRRAFISSDLLSDSYPQGFVSSHDQDGDGIDDQTEILQNARAYIATRPIYESRYYDTGYPNDGYGVCSDIIAFAMRDAGYDLQELIAADVAQAPTAYREIKSPDRKIDFRRVVNLQVYFERHFISKTTDLTQLDEWQGGDIIFFDHHVAVVSDRRNAEGIPYIIHHRSKSQLDYEEDYLGIRSDITAHFRISE